VSSQRSQALGQGLLPTRVNNTVGGFLIKYLTLGIFVNLILPFSVDNSIEKLSSVQFRSAANTWHSKAALSIIKQSHQNFVGASCLMFLCGQKKEVDYLTRKLFSCSAVLIVRK
jgi:hypothetical protein